ALNTTVPMLLIAGGKKAFSPELLSAMVVIVPALPVKIPETPEVFEARNATVPASLMAGPRPKSENAPLVSATVVREIPLPVKIPVSWTANATTPELLSDTPGQLKSIKNSPDTVLLSAIFVN